MLKMVKNLVPKNGSYFKHGNHLVKIINTCSIDYFIIFCYVLSKKRKDIITKQDIESQDFFIKFLKDIETILDKRNWDQARLT